MGAVSIPRVSRVTWDEHRNTSRVFPVPPGAVEAADRALRAWTRENPKHAAWVAAGAPPINSQEDHVEWFGEPYVPRKRVK
jgi:hypothetical protein